MNRIVYSPSIECQKQAEELAVEVGLPIIIGDNDHTKNLDFDRTKVQILFIPKEKVFDHPKVTKKLFACPIGYANDWLNFDHTFKCLIQIDDLIIEPKLSYMENHFIRYIARFPKAGIWNVKIMRQEDVIEQSEIKVV
jgi:hypothetical protein